MSQSRVYRDMILRYEKEANLLRARRLELLKTLRSPAQSPRTLEQKRREILLQSRADTLYAEYLHLCENIKLMLPYALKEERS